MTPSHRSGGLSAQIHECTTVRPQPLHCRLHKVVTPSTASRTSGSKRVRADWPHLASRTVELHADINYTLRSLTNDRDFRLPSSISTGIFLEHLPAVQFGARFAERPEESPGKQLAKSEQNRIPIVGPSLPVGLAVLQRACRAVGRRF